MTVIVIVGFTMGCAHGVISPTTGWSWHHLPDCDGNAT